MRQENSYSVFCPKMFQHFHIVYYRCTLLQSLCKNRFFFFLFSSADMQKFHHVLGCHNIGINSLLIFFKFFAFFKFNMPSQKSDKNNSIRIIFIKIIIKINIIKIYIKIPISLQLNRTLPESLLK